MTIGDIISKTISSLPVPQCKKKKFLLTQDKLIEHKNRAILKSLNKPAVFWFSLYQGGRRYQKIKGTLSSHLSF